MSGHSSNDFIRKLGTTPMRDVVRGRLSSRLDVRKPTQDLPQGLRELADATVRATRLKRVERAQVATELADHFEQGLADGKDPTELIAAFGDGPAAAKLIRRAVVRQRPLTVRALGWLAWGTGLASAGVVLGTGSLVTSIALAKPPANPTNYVAQHNAASLALPASDRAWDLYIEAFDALEVPDRGDDDYRMYRDYDPGITNDEASLAVMRRIIQQNDEALALITNGASRTHFGSLLMTAPSDWADANSLGRWQPARDGALFEILLPHLSPMRRSARLLATRAHISAIDGDGASALQDIQSLERLGLHARENAFLIGSLVSLAIQSLGTQTASSLIYHHPEAFSASDLAGFQALFRTDPRAIVADGLEQDRIAGIDTANRYYSANGMFLLPEFQKLLNDMRPDIGSVVSAYATAAIDAGRDANLEAYERWIDRARSLALRAPWDVPSLDELDPEQHASGPGWRFVFLNTFAPSFDRTVGTGFRAWQQREEVRIAAAMELFSRAEGRWANRPDELAPFGIPNWPRDMHTGDPLRFNTDSETPVIYGLGWNRTDEGGKRSEASAAWRPADWEPSESVLDAATRGPRGDHVLWPPQPEHSN
ncbi:MAG: hypothetical protein AAGB51_07600 [Planctomycetota bacterium]